jgi:GNAT superfamily N-acetyltransferase
MEELAQLNITQETLPSMLEGAGRGLVVEFGGKIVAFSMANATEKTIFALFVRPDYEGKGLGRLLMQEAEQWLLSQGCQESWLLTDRNPQVRAQGFYRHLGWRDDGIQENGQVRFIKQLTSGAERQFERLVITT